VTTERRHAVLARRYGDVLRVGDGRAADRVVADALAEGMAPEAVQTLVIAPAMVRIGDLWESGVISVADEHLATSVSQRVLVRLFDAMTARRHRGHTRERVLLAAVEGQRHVLGLQMVSDVLEGAGFEVLYLGDDVPVEGLRGFVARHQPAVVGLAYGTQDGGGLLLQALQAIHLEAPGARIMLGGRAVPPRLAAAGYPHVRSPMEVVERVEALLADPPPVPAPGAGILVDGDEDLPIPLEDAEQPDPVVERLARVADEVAHLARTHVRRSATYRELAFRDPLTHTVDRRVAEHALRRLLGERSAPSGALLLVDLDGFARRNALHGSAVGDDLLRRTAESIAACIGPDDTLARVGGDAFAVVQAGATRTEAVALARRARGEIAVAAPPLTACVGVALVAGDVRTTFLAADTALCTAKAAGPDTTVVSPPVAAP
jgi:diguanylate cyclase (GGDEF)-like protein